jgi:GT2 family glycosyltransferase
MTPVSLPVFWPSRHREPIQPVPASIDRPLWSVMIPTYNSSIVLRQALSSVLAQDPGPNVMQIEVVDDCSSSDDAEQVVTALGRGRVRFFRRSRNGGHVRTFNTCLQRSTGHLVHLLHSDDYVESGFYRQMGELFAEHPEVGAAFCRHTVVDDDGRPKWTSPLERDSRGVLPRWLERIACGLPLQAPAMAVRRATYETIGGFDSRLLSCGEDWEMWVRIATAGPVAYHPELLAVYRDSTGSLTKRALRSGQNIRDVRRATAIIRGYLPPALAATAVPAAAQSWADWAMTLAEQLLARGEPMAALAQVREGLKCSRSRRTIAAGARVLGGLATEWRRRNLKWLTDGRQR